MRPDMTDVDLFAACFARNSTPKRREMLEWQYLKNPTKNIFVDFAVANERLAAIYATLPARVRVAGHVALAVQSVDTITDVDFRGRGLFLRLAESTYARAQAAGAQLVYGFPNGSSAHGFFKRLDWTNLDPIPFLIRPLRTGYVLEQLKMSRYAKWIPNLPIPVGPTRLPKRLRIEPITRFDERSTGLWASFVAEDQVAVERDAAYLNWRLVDKPGESYETLGVFEHDDLIAFVTYVVKEKHGGRIGYVMESLCRPKRGRELRALLRRALAAMTSQGADVVLAWCFPHSRTFASFLRCGFAPFPTKYRPIELHFGARSFSPDGTIARQRDRWYLSYTDADTT